MGKKLCLASLELFQNYGFGAKAGTGQGICGMGKGNQQRQGAAALAEGISLMAERNMARPHQGYFAKSVKGERVMQRENWGNAFSPSFPQEASLAFFYIPLSDPSSPITSQNFICLKQNQAEFFRNKTTFSTPTQPRS